jgi:hypothetical protein
VRFGSLTLQLYDRLTADHLSTPLGEARTGIEALAYVSQQANVPYVELIRGRGLSCPPSLWR